MTGTSCGCIGPPTRFAGCLTSGQLYVNRFLGGTCYVLFNAAESEAMPTLIPTARIPEAVAVRETASAGASIIAPPLGGLRYDLQPVLPFAGDAVSYAVPAVALGRVRSRFADREGPRESGGLRADMS